MSLYLFFFHRPTQDQLLIDWSATINEVVSPVQMSSPDSCSLEGTGMHMKLPAQVSHQLKRRLTLLHIYVPVVAVYFGFSSTLYIEMPLISLRAPLISFLKVVL